MAADGVGMGTRTVRSAGAARRGLVAAAVVASLVLAGCSSDGSDGAGPERSGEGDPTTTTAAAAPFPEEHDQVCASAAALLYVNVATEASGDEGAPEVGLTPEQVIDFLGDLRREADEDALADIDVVEAAAEAFKDDPNTEGDDGVREAYDRLIGWAAGTCEPSAPIWACLQRRTFTTIGDFIPESDQDAGDPVGDAPSPEAALSEEALAAPGEVTAVVEEDDRVVFAWVEEHQLVRKVVSVALGDAGWGTEVSSTCSEDDGEAGSESFEPVGGPVPED